MKIEKKYLITWLVVTWGALLQAQVTIGLDEQANTGALLDLRETTPANPSTDNSTSDKGLGLTRVNLTSQTDLFPMFNDDGSGGYSLNGKSYDKTAQDLKHEGLLVYNVGAVLTPGLYVWSGSEWVLAENSAESWQVSGTKSASVSNTDDIYQSGSVTVGNSDVADKSAILNIVSDSQGVLLPRVTLTSSTDQTTIANPTTGLLVYNTGDNSNFSTSGFMYWNGTEWRLISNNTSEDVSATLECTAASMSPSQQIVGGTAITSGTVLQIPYTRSNGGNLTGVTLTSTGNTNVTATISSGVLASGTGYLIFELSGTPITSQTAPTGITFDLTPLLKANPGLTGCTSITIGNTLSASIEETSVMGYLSLVKDSSGNDTSTQYYALQCDSPDGKFSIRIAVPVSQTSVVYGNQYINVHVRNNTTSSLPIIWNYNTDYGGAISGGGVLTVPSQVWGGDLDSGSTWTKVTGSNTSNGSYWGNVGIYDGAHSGPEYRRYTWIPQGSSYKTSYEAHVMVALDTTTPTTAVTPTKLKGYILFTQATAK